MRAIAVTPSTQQIALIDQPEPEISLLPMSSCACSKLACAAPGVPVNFAVTAPGLGGVWPVEQNDARKV
jgi:hypothetical protein